MNPSTIKRRSFLRTAAAGTAAVAMGSSTGCSTASKTSVCEKPALLGGRPVRTEPFASWPLVEEPDEKVWMDVLHKRAWFRYNGTYVSQFEKEYKELMGAKDCIAVANGTSALFASLNALGIGPGDEVLVPPYTFIATVSVVLLQHALPVFVDTDPESFQMDATKIEAKITDKTRCIIPVHLGGNVCDMDAILAIGKKHNIPIVEDACQSHLAEWRGKKVGTLGKTGCFSFQVSKNLSAGEGGAVISDDIPLMDRVHSFQTNGRSRTKTTGYSYGKSGTNIRMTEFQGALLTRGLTRLEKQSQARDRNAVHLTERLKEIPGIQPAKEYDGCTRNAYHLYMFRYDPRGFGGLPRSRFIEALRKEGIPCAAGYSPLNKEPFLADQLQSRMYRAVYSEKRIKDCLEGNECPANDKLCNEEAVWFFQTMLLGTTDDMDQIADAVEKIRKHAGALKKA